MNVNLCANYITWTRWINKLTGKLIIQSPLKSLTILERTEVMFGSFLVTTSTWSFLNKLIVFEVLLRKIRRLLLLDQTMWYKKFIVSDNVFIRNFYVGFQINIHWHIAKLYYSFIFPLSINNDFVNQISWWLALFFQSFCGFANFQQEKYVLEFNSF